MYVQMQNFSLQLRHRKPVIGSQARYCPHCKRVMSYSDKAGLYCRNCHENVRIACQKYSKSIKEGN